MGHGGRRAAVLAVLLAVAGCTAPGPRAGGEQPGPVALRRVHPVSRPARQHAPALGEAGPPASPLPPAPSAWGSSPGTGHGASSGVADVRAPRAARADDQEKIVWRMTGTGLLRLAVLGPAGPQERGWGPAEHGSSTWDKPGQEWGAGYVFTRPGCWDLRAVRGRATADVWLRVIKC